AAVSKVDVVERVVLLVAKEEEGNPARISVAGISVAVFVVAKVDPEDGTPGTARRELRNLAGGRIRVTGRREKEGAELAIRQPSQILRTLERRGPCGFGQCGRRAQAHQTVLWGSCKRHPLDRIGRSRRM